MMTYTIEIDHEYGEKTYIPLDAKSDRVAMRMMRDYLKKNRPDANAFLSFHRSRDGQRGFLNQDGASPTGKAWE